MEFKKNDYIVLTKGPFYNLKLHNEYSSNFKVNHIYKQKMNSHQLMTYLDSMYSTTNGWSAYNANNRINWRFATKAEEILYNKYDKPVKINNINNIDNFSII